MSVSQLLNTPPAGWSNLKVSSLNSAGEITSSSEIVAPQLLLVEQAGDPAQPINGRTSLYYNNATDKLKVFNTGTNTWDSLSTGGIDTNIYNSDGTLTGVRTVNTAGFPLSITDGITDQLNISPIKTELNSVAEVNIDAPITKVYGNNLLELLCGNIMTVDSPIINLAQIPPSSLTNDKLITRNAATGDVELRDVSTLPPTVPTGNANALAAFDGFGNLSSLSSYANGSNLVLSSSAALPTSGSNNMILCSTNANQSNCVNVCSINANLTTNINSADCLTVGHFCQLSNTSNVVMFNDNQTTNNFCNAAGANSMRVRMLNGVNITNNPINSNNASSALLQLDSTTKGIIIPRMTTANRLALAGVNGLLVYDTDLSALQIFTSSWGYLRANALEIANQPVSAVVPTANQYLKFVGGSWTPTTLDIYDYIRLNSTGNLSNNQYTTVAGQSATESSAQYLIYQTSALAGFRVNLTVAPGVGNSRTFTLRVNGVNTAQTITIVDANTTGSITGNVALVAGDRISCFHTVLGAANATGQITISVLQV